MISLFPYVLDASVLAKVAVDEPGADEVRAWYEEHAAEDFRGPALLYSEMGRVIQKAHRKAGWTELQRIHDGILRPVQLEPPSSADGKGVWKVGAKLSFYDAEYVRLAQRLGAVLVTADKKMAEHARMAGVKVKEF